MTAAVQRARDLCALAREVVATSRNHRNVSMLRRYLARRAKP